MTLDDVTAHIEIQQVLYRYCRGVDRGEYDLLRDVYHPDATDNHGAWVGLGKDFADYLIPAMDGPGFVGQHHITNILIALNGAQADVESYFIAFHPLAGDGAARHAFVAGRYLDGFERRDGVWKIAQRVVVIDLSRPMGPGETWEGAASFPGGGRRETDPSAQLFSSLE